MADTPPTEADVARWFSFAIFHSQLGSVASARYRFDMGDQWLRQHKSRNEELLRLRAEAAESLAAAEQSTE